MSLLPWTPSSSDSSFPALSGFLCARRWMRYSSPLPALGGSREALEEMQKIAVPSEVEARCGQRALVFSRSGKRHSVKSGLEWASARPQGTAPPKPALVKPSWRSEITGARSFLADLSGRMEFYRGARPHVSQTLKSLLYPAVFSQ